MNNLRKHRPFNRIYFEKVLAGISGFKEFPSEWYEHDWLEDRDGKWKRVSIGINEYCYIVPLTFHPIRLLKIYSSLNRDTGLSRSVGNDAIRIVVADNFGEPKHQRFARINRGGTWELNLKRRVSRALNDLGVDMTCPKCKRVLFLKRNRGTNSRFLGCSKYPSCDYARTFVV